METANHVLLIAGPSILLHIAPTSEMAVVALAADRIAARTLCKVRLSDDSDCILKGEGRMTAR
jgi:hypothetical protein